MLSIQSSTSRPHPFAELSFTLFDTLDFENRLMKAVRFAVGNFCDWCSVEIIDKNGVNQTRVVLPREDGNELPERTLVQEVVHLTSIDDTTLHSHFDSQDERTFFKSLGSKSLIILPLSARGSVFGNITFISRTRIFDEGDLSFAKEIAEILGLSADNARLYEEAQAAIHSRDEVLGVVAHDLKNPLSAIRLSSQVFQRKLERAEEGLIPIAQVEKVFHSIDRSVERAIRLITDLLDFEKATSGRLQVDPKPVSVEQLLSEAVELLRPLALERSLDLNWKSDAPERKVQCEPERIQQVLSNLLGNAIKFTPPKGRIEVRAEDRGSEMLFSVSDTGPGIAAHDMKHLFERYWQAKKTHELGSGLGLPICKGIVEAHRGRIWAESVVGEGTTFYFTLPTADLLC